MLLARATEAHRGVVRGTCALVGQSRRSVESAAPSVVEGHSVAKRRVPVMPLWRVAR